MTKSPKILLNRARVRRIGPRKETQRLSERVFSQFAEHAEALYHLGLQAYQRGDLSEAVVRLSEAARLRPNWEPVLTAMGTVLFAAGRSEQAVQTLEQAAAAGPDRPEPLNNLGVALNHLHRYAEARRHLARALELRPNDAAILNNLGIALQGLERYEEAAEMHSRAIANNPSSAEAYLHRGQALAALERPDRALADFHRAAELAPDWPDVYNEIGRTEVKRQEWPRALGAYNRAVELDTSFSQAYYNRANLRVLMGCYDEAVADFTRAVKQNPDFADAYWNRGLARLLKGDYAQGWEDYTWRKHPAAAVPTYPHRLTGPEWTGRPLEGRRLLVHYEQGYGDSIQCWRFLPQVRQCGGTVIVEERPPLVALLGETGWADEVIASRRTGPPQVAYDLHVSMLDLPRIFRARPDNVGRTVPYLRAPADRAASWAGRIDPQAFSIGIVWAGSPLHPNDLNRSARLTFFLPLSRIPGVRLYSLQKGPAKNDLDSAASAGIIVEDLGQDLKDFADTAGALAHLDLVISVDTAVLHLAGAMGRRAWGLLPFAPDWRWMRDVEVSPWYPTVRLFRQPEWDDWNQVFIRVIHEVKKIVHGKSGGDHGNTNIHRISNADGLWTGAEGAGGVSAGRGYLDAQSGGGVGGGVSR